MKKSWNYKFIRYGKRNNINIIDIPKNIRINITEYLKNYYFYYLIDIKSPYLIIYNEQNI